MAGNAARAYDLRAQTALPQQPQQPQRQTRVRVVPGTQAPGVAPSTVAMARIVLAVVAVFVVLGLARVALTAATTTTMISQQEISASVDAMRTSNASLEVQKSMLTSPAHVKMQATIQGLSSPELVESLAVGADIVGTDAAGNLSLSQSLALAS